MTEPDDVYSRGRSIFDRLRAEQEDEGDKKAAPGSEDREEGFSETGSREVPSPQQAEPVPVEDHSEPEGMAAEPASGAEDGSNPGAPPLVPTVSDHLEPALEVAAVPTTEAPAGDRTGAEADEDATIADGERSDEYTTAEDEAVHGEHAPAEEEPVPGEHAVAEDEAAHGENAVTEDASFPGEHSPAQSEPVPGEHAVADDQPGPDDRWAGDPDTSAQLPVGDMPTSGDEELTGASVSGWSVHSPLSSAPEAAEDRDPDAAATQNELAPEEDPFPPEHPIAPSGEDVSPPSAPFGTGQPASRDDVTTSPAIESAAPTDTETPVIGHTQGEATSLATAPEFEVPQPTDLRSEPQEPVVDTESDLPDIGPPVPMSDAPLPKPPLPRVFAVANQKGGVGKTTTTVNLSASLAELGFRVLVIDLDPQGNATTGLGINSRNLDTSVYDVLLHDVPLEDCIEPTSLRNLFVVPATIDLAGAEIELVPAFSRELRLRRAVDAIVDDFDYVLIDCPPSLGLLTVNGLAAATEVLVPIQCEYYALEGLGQLLRNVTLVQSNLNPRLDVSTIVCTMYDARTRLAEQVVAEVRDHFGPKVCRMVIPRTVRLSEAPSFGQPVIVFDPSSRGALAYRELAKEVSGGPPQRTGEGPGRPDPDRSDVRGEPLGPT